MPLQRKASGRLIPLAVMLLLLSSLPAWAAADFEARIDSSQVLPVVDQAVEVAVTLTYRGAAPIDQARVTIEHVRPDGRVTALGTARDYPRLEPGQVVETKTTLVPALTGFHRFRARLSRNGGESEITIDAGDLPVLSRPLAIMYWHSPQDTRYLTWRLCTSDEDAAYWSSRGVVAARWMPGIAKRKHEWTQSHFLERWSEPLPSTYTAIAIDEFNGVHDAGTDIEMAKALVQLQAQGPDRLTSVWTIGFDPESEQTKAFQQAADLVMLECYSDHFAAYGRFAERWADVRRANLADKAIFALWFDRVITTEQTLRRQIQHIRRTAPESRGICFNGQGSDPLLAAADQYVYEYFVKPVLLVERGSQGRWQCRNIGWMTARDVRVEGPGNARHIPAIEPGDVVDLGAGSRDGLKLVPSKNYTWLRSQDHAAAESTPWEARMPKVADVDDAGANLLVGREPSEQSEVCVQLPIEATLFQQPFAFVFDIAFDSVGMYGIAAVGLGNSGLGDDPDAFLDLFGGKSPSPGRMEMRFYRGDIENRSAYKIAGARGKFGYENAQGEFVRATPALSFEAGKRYRVWVVCEATSVEVAVANLTDAADEVWRSGRMLIDSTANFDEMYVRVRDATASSIELDAERGEARLRSGTARSPTDRIRTAATLSRVRVVPLSTQP